MVAGCCRLVPSSREVPKVEGVAALFYPVPVLFAPSPEVWWLGKDSASGRVMTHSHERQLTLGADLAVLERITISGNMSCF